MVFFFSGTLPGNTTRFKKEKVMKNAVISLVAVLILFGCSAAGLQKAEQETSIVALANPLGEVIHFPLLVASTVANAATKPEFVVEKREPWRPGLPGDISREEYEALSDEEYVSLIARARGAERKAARSARGVGRDHPGKTEGD
ncbi:MAG: hypothetical protein RBR38_09870 [Desulfomicrobium apsheronum]|nr:hypothetical protein [Desulfomicrobium apsheronum]